MTSALTKCKVTPSSDRSVRILFPIEPTTGIRVQWLGLMIMSSVLKNAGFEVEMVKADLNCLRSKLSDKRPTLLGYSVPTYLAKFYLDFNSVIKKEFDVFSLFGGPHPTYFPEMIKTEGVDAVCIGEGDHLILELAQNLENDKPINHIENLWVKQNGQIHKNPLRPLTQDLDDIPFPDRTLFAPYQPRSSLSPTGVMTSRGCPYQCSYCFNKAFRGLYKDQKGIPVVRLRSVDNVISELEDLKLRYPATYFVFWDDIFPLSMDWLEEFTEKYRTKIAIPFNCNIRANLLNEKKARLLKKAGCQLAAMGIEAGNDYLRNKILKRNMKKDHIINAIEILKKERILVQSFNLIGIPKGTIENDLETLELNSRSKVDYAMCFIIQPYHKTELYDIAKEEGLLSAHFDGLDTLDNPYGYHPPVRRNPQKRLQIENLHKLFAILAKSKIPLPIVRVLLKLPLGKLYSILFKSYFSYSRYIKLPPKKIHRILLALRKSSSPKQKLGDIELKK